MDNIIDEHKAMVLRLKKPGEKIKSELTAADCDLIHMAACLPGEGSELYEAVANDLTLEDITEELGDFEFYWTACMSLIVGGERQTFTIPEDEDPALDTKDATVQLMVLGGKFWDEVKRLTIYRKELDFPKAYTLLRHMEIQLAYLRRKYSLTLEAVLEANWTKLADKDKGRYREGTYSDQQAQARLDKQ